MSGQRLGKAFIKVDGKLLETMPGAKIDLGGFQRAPVIGSNAMHGYAETTKPATLECEISVGRDTTLEDLRKITNATVTFECDTGQTYIVKDAFLEDTLSVTEGEGGKVPIKLTGAPAEEMRAA